MTIVIREYKDRLFTFIFGREENRAWTLSLYNAVNGSHYSNPEEIQITTIKEVLYMGMHNDVSFMISEQLNLYEQQSTYNPNMPLRLMQYVGNLYEQYLKKYQHNKYGSTLIMLPVPRLVVFYNGEIEKPDEMMLRLSSSFPEDANADIEVRVRMLNINHGKNAELLKACQPLREYSWFIHQIRIRKAAMPADDAGSLTNVVNQAISEMPDSFTIKPFILIHQAEVLGMLLTEYDEAETMKLFQRDSYNQGKEDGFKLGKEDGFKLGKEDGFKLGKEDGFKLGKEDGFKLGKEDGFKLGKEDGFKLGKEDGFKLGNINMLTNLVKQHLLSLTDAARQLNISEADFQKLMETPQQ